MTTATEERALQRVSDRFFSLLGVRLVLWLAVVSVLVPHLLKDPFSVTDHYDEHYFYAHDDAARISIVDYHQLPAWNPFYCGGIPLAANPQDGALAPDFLLRIIFGTGPGRRLAVVLFLLLGLEGMFQLARRHASSAPAAAAAAVMFAASGRFFFMLEFGWINMFGFQLLPWAVLGFENGIRSWRWRIVGGFAVGWMLLAGGTYSTPYTVLVLVALTLYDMIRRLLRPAQDPGDGIAWWRPAWSLVGVGLVTALFAAAKFLPMLSVVSQHPRTIHNTHSHDTMQVLETMLVSHSQNPQGSAAEGYVGLAIAALGLFSLLTRDRAAIRFMVMVGVFFALAMGDQGAGSLWSTVRLLPLYNQLRDPLRFTLIVAFFLSLAASRTLTYLEDVPQRVIHALAARVQTLRKKPIPNELPFGLRVALGLLGALLVSGVGYLAGKMLILDDHLHQKQFTQDPPLAAKQDFHQARGNRWDAQVWAPASRGTLQCFEETEFSQSPRLRGDLAAEEFPLDGAPAKVQRTSWSPNHIRLHVHADKDSTIAINQNFSRRWSTNVGTMQDVDGELAVAVAAGDSDLDLRYDDRWLDIGVIVSILTTLGGAALFFAWAKKRLMLQIESARSMSSPKVAAAAGADGSTTTATPELSPKSARITDGDIPDP
ncbi:MAG: hypothetical protein ABI461_03530 [Polyangiaceae bacterium]